MLLWVVQAPHRLLPEVHDALASTANTVHVSAASIWEAGIKYGLGRERTSSVPIRRLRTAVKETGFATMAVTAEHAFAVAELPSIHDDPFDRLLIAQAMVEGLTLVTHDKIMQRYPIRTLPA